MDSAAKHVALDEPNPPTIENTEVTPSSNDNNNCEPVVSTEMANETVIESGESIDIDIDQALTPDNLTVTVTYTFTFVLSILFSVSKDLIILLNDSSFSETFLFCCNQPNIKRIIMQSISTFLFLGVVNPIFSPLFSFSSLFLTTVYDCVGKGDRQ